MKNYLNLAIRVNIAILLAVEIVAALVLPIVITLILTTNIGSSGPNAGLWIGHITNAVIIFLAGFWVFKMTYGNMRKMGKEITIINSVIYSAVLFVLVNGALAFFIERGGVLGVVIGTVVAFIAFYLAGNSAEKKNQQEKIIQSQSNN